MKNLERGTKPSVQVRLSTRSRDESKPHMEDLAILHRGNKARALQRNEWNRRCQTLFETSDSAIPTCLSTSVSFGVVEEMARLLWLHGSKGSMSGMSSVSRPLTACRLLHGVLKCRPQAWHIFDNSVWFMMVPHH